MASELTITPLRCGTISAPAEMFETEATGESIVPVYAFLIRHPTKPPVLFDTGIHPDLHEKLWLNTYANTLPQGQDIASRLEQVGVDGGLGAIILSHTHYDHAGGLALIGDAPVYVSGKEDIGAIETGHDIRRTGEHLDVFGDGLVEIFATPGHTAGHQSLRVRRFGGHDVLTADACYFCRALAREDADQPYAVDKEAYVATKRRLAQMQADGDFIIPGHDESFLGQIPENSTLRVDSAVSLV